MSGVLVVATSMAGVRVRAMTCVGMPWGRYRLGPLNFTMVVAVLVIVAALVMTVICHEVVASIDEEQLPGRPGPVLAPAHHSCHQKDQAQHGEHRDVHGRRPSEALPGDVGDGVGGRAYPDPNQANG